MQPVLKRSAEAMAADALRDYIVSGSIAPGARLTEIYLSEKLAVSRATVRMALLHLSSEGLVVLVPYTGWSVMELTAHDAWELYTLRSSLEALAARIATKNLTEEGRQLVQEAFDALVAACRVNNRLAVADNDFALHKVIIGLANHKRLADQYRLVEQQVRLYIASSDALIGDTKAIIKQHEPIVEAILAGDPQLAAEASENHNTTEGEILVDHLRASEATLKAS
jgi:DNA-binding GntR family transcriptional regulator